MPRPPALVWFKRDLQVRGLGYRKALSSPLSAQEGCSRLSPHLAFGTFSLRTVHQATEVAIASTPGRMAYALRGFAGRLRWHCHFVQKLEDEPGIEFHNFARVCEGLRENNFNDTHFVAWCAGRTGYPMVDACMCSLIATGWLNFRMRATARARVACRPRASGVRAFLKVPSGQARKPPRRRCKGICSFERIRL